MSQLQQQPCFLGHISNLEIVQFSLNTQLEDKCIAAHQMNISKAKVKKMKEGLPRQQHLCQ